MVAEGKLGLGGKQFIFRRSAPFRIARRFIEPRRGVSYIASPQSANAFVRTKLYRTEK